MQSNPNSKKRKFGDISNQKREEEKILFGYSIITLKHVSYSDRGDGDGDDLDYRNEGRGEDEAFEDDDAVFAED